MRILVTGGAGYIGSHFVKMAVEQGNHEIITVDNLHNGHSEAVLSSTLNLIEVMEQYGVDKMIFSSTASVYGQPKKIPIAETSTLSPASPYGKSKAFVENILLDMKQYKGINTVCLRYFNAAGADESGLIGEAHTPETHLIPLAIKTALSKQNKIGIFGNTTTQQKTELL